MLIRSLIPLSIRDQTPSKRTVTYRSCMPWISVHHYVSLESEPRPIPFPPPLLTLSKAREPSSMNIRLFSRLCLAAVTQISREKSERDPCVNGPDP